MGQPESRLRPSNIRRDGWTVERQLAFLDALARTRSITKAARSVRMSRESAYRLRARQDGRLFATLWDRALADSPALIAESHISMLSNGRFMRLLGNHYRRERGDFARIGAAGPQTRSE